LSTAQKLRCVGLNEALQHITLDVQ